MKKDDDDQTSTRLQVHDGTRVLKAGKSVVMVAWRAGMWRRNLRVVILLLVIILGVFIWSSVTKDEPAAAKKTETTNTGTDSASASAPLTREEARINFAVEGRGLVYNCKNKNFYCVDKDNYYRCRDTAKTGKATCITRGVLDSTQLCQSELKSRSPQEVSCP